MNRLANPQDFNFVYELYMHPQVNPFLLYEDMDTASFRPIFDALLLQQVKYVYCNDRQCIGMFKLIHLQYRTDHIAYLGGLAIDPMFSGKGEGGRMMNEIIALAGEKGFLRIELSVADINAKAIQLYEKCGFQKEGLLRKYSHLKSRHTFMDEVLMSFLF